MNARQRSREDLRVHNAIARQQGLDPSSFKAWSAWFAWGTGPLAHIHRALRRGQAYAHKRRLASARKSMRRSAQVTAALLHWAEVHYRLRNTPAPAEPKAIPQHLLDAFQ